MFAQRPQPRAEPVELEVRPAFAQGLAPVGGITSVEEVAFGQRFSPPGLGDGALNDVGAGVDRRRRPIMEALGAVVPADEVHGVGGEGTVAEPAVAVGGKGRTGDVGPARGLVRQDDLHAALKEIGHRSVLVASR